YRLSRRVARPRKGKGDARTCEDRRATGPGGFQGASLLRLVARMGVAGRRSGAAYGTCVRVERQRSLDLVVLRALLRVLRIDRAGPIAGRPGIDALAGSLVSRMGLSRHHPLPVRRLCRGTGGLRSRA